MAAMMPCFFIALALVACSDAKLSSEYELHPLKYVADGDTIVIGDATKVRMVGINTPELGGGNPEPFAKHAKERLKTLLGKGKVGIAFDIEKQDKHGRQLAHVFSSNGVNAQIKLLEAGLAFAVAVGDNQTYLSDYLKAESKAWHENLGIWGDAYFAPQKAGEVASQRSKGYKRVIGEVTKTSQSSKHINLHLGERFKVLIPKPHWKAHFNGKAKQFLNKKLIVRGWVFTLSNASGVKVYHPSMIEIQQ